VAVVLAAAKKADEPIASPEGRGPFTATDFTCISLFSWGIAGRGHAPVVDPFSVDAARWLGNKRMPPLRQYLSRVRKKAEEPIAVPKGHGPLTL
jgi:hypothetical protein